MLKSHFYRFILSCTCLALSISCYKSNMRELALTRFLLTSETIQYMGPWSKIRVPRHSASLGWAGLYQRCKNCRILGSQYPEFFWPSRNFLPTQYVQTPQMFKAETFSICKKNVHILRKNYRLCNILQEIFCPIFH